MRLAESSLLVFAGLFSPFAQELETRRLGLDPVGWTPHKRDWQPQDGKTLKRINHLITDSLRDPFASIGKPEPLKHILSGAWSRRIDGANRLAYYVTDDHIVILQAREHY